MIYNRVDVVIENFESFIDNWIYVVATTASLPSVDQPLFELLLLALEVDDTL